MSASWLTIRPRAVPGVLRSEQLLVGRQHRADLRLGNRVDELQAVLLHPAQDLVQRVAGLVGVAILVAGTTPRACRRPRSWRSAGRATAGDPGPAGYRPTPGVVELAAEGAVEADDT